MVVENDRSLEERNRLQHEYSTYSKLSCKLLDEFTSRCNKISCSVDGTTANIKACLQSDEELHWMKSDSNFTNDRSHLNSKDSLDSLEMERKILSDQLERLDEERNCAMNKLKNFQSEIRRLQRPFSSINDGNFRRRSEYELAQETRAVVPYQRPHADYEPHIDVRENRK